MLRQRRIYHMRRTRRTFLRITRCTANSPRIAGPRRVPRPGRRQRQRQQRYTLVHTFPPSQTFNASFSSKMNINIAPGLPSV